MPDILTAYAEGQPDKLAVIDDRPDGGLVTWTYAELEEQSNKLGNALATLGVEPGQKVIWCGPNSPGIVKIMQATRKVGTVAVPLNYRLTAPEARYIIAHSDSSIAYVDAEYAHLFAPEDEQSGLPGSLRHVIVYGGPAPDGMLSEDDLVAGASAEPPEEVQQGMGGSTMIYTSGTTGKPKGAVRQFRDEASIIALITFIGYQTDDIYITSGPLYHSGPGSFMAIGLALGQTVVIQRKFDPEDWLRLVDKHKVTSTFSAPALVRMICALPAEVKAKYDRSSMKRMIANAAPWSFALKQAYLADFPADSLWEVYGSTELGINCVLEPKDQLRKPGSCGKPAPMVEIMLVDADGKEVTGIGPDQPGELFVRSAQIFAEYYKQPDSYEKARRGEYHTVGDIAYRDEEGFYFICDRKNDMIISGGMNIYPAEIEAALEQHPKIYDVAVFGIPSEEWGELVHATIVVAPDAELSETEVIEFSREHLAGYKTPRSVAFTDELPRTGSGKILKRELRAPYWQGRTANV
ncbi:MAG TPA: AMP-binding protein [Streptosporangiaceae bacterium]|nr:AMP-binding protein [Streptosporangiaceae bacterium]